jgi:beta-lactamase class D
MTSIRSRKYLLIGIFLISSIIFTENDETLAAESTIQSRNEKNYFSQMKGCFLLYNMKKKTFDKVIGEENCRERFVACSTFKIPLAVMAFDSGVLKDENQVLNWDGKKGFLESHNQDHSGVTWMRDSVVWFSRRLTVQLGMKKMRKYLREFHYGNEDFSAGLTEAWLVSPGNSDPALKISAYEQVDFMNKLWADQLPVSKRAMQLTRKILFLEHSPHGFNFSGKTGSNYFDVSQGQEKRVGLGWFVSHLQKGDQEYIAVTRFSDLVPVDQKKYGGLRAKQITKDILADQGLW